MLLTGEFQSYDIQSFFAYRLVSLHKILNYTCSISLGTSDEGKYNEKIIKLSKTHANQMNINVVDVLNHHVS